MKLRLENYRGVAIALVLSLLAASPLAAQNKTLRWNLKEGQKFNIEITQDQQQNMNVPGQPEMEIPIEQGTYMTWEVTGADSDKFNITQVITRMTMSMAAPMMEIEYDSDDGEADGMAAQMAATIEPVIDAEIKFVMNARGEISDVEIPEDVIDAIESAGGGMMGANGLNADALKQLVNQSSLVLPEDPASGGVTWANENKIDTPMMNMAVKTDYEYIGEEEVNGNKIHKISTSSEVEIEAGENALGGSVELEDQESTGEVWFDNNAGYMIGAKSTQKMIMIMEVQGMEMEMESEAIVEVKITPSDDK